MASPAEPELTDDRLLGGRLRFQQPARGYRVAIDPVLLAAAVAAKDGDKVLDAGAGTAAAALCLASRVATCQLTGLERDAELLAIGRRNVASNGLGDRIVLLEGDLLAPPAVVRLSAVRHRHEQPALSSHSRGQRTPDPDGPRGASRRRRPACLDRSLSRQASIARGCSS